VGGQDSGNEAMLLERGLPAKNDYAIFLHNRVESFAGKPRSNGIFTDRHESFFQSPQFER
jgi:hypothetical protein